ncbi:hypothetical protein Pfo_021074 [Paulownia fortunei]|nr:hypothetical protein Pfo_021074 [Paulownia fortunei]
MAENQELVKPKEREIPVFTVLKNNCILKNIFLLDNPPSISSSSFSVAENVDQESEVEEILVVGRHPDCNIKLEHPSISRFHLRIHSKPTSRSLFVTDLSSVHGTWISGKRIEPGVRMKLNEGDTLHLGASSRLYRLNWVPLSCAYDIDNPFVPQLDAADTFDEETEGAIDQDSSSLSNRNDQVQTLSDTMEGLERLFSDEDLGSSMHKMSPTAPLMPEDLYNSFSNKEEVENNSSPGIYNQENELSSSQLSQFEIENSTPRAHFLSAVSQTVAQLETMETSGMNSEKRSGLSIWSRRGKPESVQIETSRSRGNCRKINVSLQVKSFSDENHKSESILNDHYASPYNEEETFTPDKENIAPDSLLVRSLKSKGEETLKSESRSGKPESVQIETSRSRGNCVNINVSSQVKSFFDENHKSESILKDHYASPYNEEETFTPDKENTAPDSLLVRSLKSKGKETLKSESISNTTVSSVDPDEEEIFTPDKENMTPNSHLLRSMKNIEKLEVVKRPKSYRSSPLKTANNSNMYQEEAMLPTLDKSSQHLKVFQEWKSTSSASKSHGTLKKQPAALKARADRDPFYPLPVNSTSNHKTNSKPSVHEDTMKGSRSINYHESEEVNHSHNNTMKVEENRWIIVVDTACLLDKKSRKELQLLRGLRGTTLVIPRIVVRELDCLLRRGSFFTRTTEVSAALQWIQECMGVAKWWIHVQSSADEGRFIPPTPPASPHWLNEDKGAFSVGSIPFSPHSLQAIVTPTAADHILECALFFKRIRNDGQLVLLSDDVTLKIKAMAEGVICETAEEFRGSLVNPFSARFLYSNSSPIGPTWSCVDDAVLKEKYYPSPSKKLSKSGEGAKGLKLILLHNSNFRQITTVS